MKKIPNTKESITKRGFLTLGLMFIAMIIMSSGVLAIAPDLQLDTLPVQWIGFDSASLAGNITTLDSISNATVYFQYKEVDAVDWIESTNTSGIASTGEVVINVSGLDSNTNYTYYVVGYYYYEGDNILEGVTSENFTTNNSPSIGYSSITNLTTDSFTFIMNLTDLGDESNVTTYVECYSDDLVFSTTNETSQIINETGLISIEVTNLTANEGYVCYGVVDFDFGGETSQVYTENVSIVTNSEDITIGESANNMNTTIFAAFGLIALFILVSAGYLISRMFQEGADIGALMTLSIAGIGVAIVLLAGIFILGTLAGLI